MRIIIARRVEKRNNIPNGLSSARRAENRYTNAKEEGVWGGGWGWEGNETVSLLLRKRQRKLEELG